MPVQTNLDLAKKCASNIFLDRNVPLSQTKDDLLDLRNHVEDLLSTLYDEDDELTGEG